MKITKSVLSLLFFATPAAAFAADLDVGTHAQHSVENTGVSGIWILANVSYAGMRAQNSSSSVWRILAFIFGFPGTLLTFFAVTEGGERAYGVEIPRKR